MESKPTSGLRRDSALGVYAAAAASLLLWSGTPIANKLAVADVDPATAGLARSALAGLLCALLAWRWKLPFPRESRQRWLLVFAGASSFAVWPLFLSLGLALTTANHAALLIATIPIFTGFMAGAVTRVRPTTPWLVGAVVALAGAGALIAMRGDGSSGVGSTVEGDLLILLGVITCAAGYVAGGTLAPSIGALPTTFWGLGVASTLLVPAIALLWPRTQWSLVSTGAYLAIGYMALCSSLLGYVAWFWALGKGGITRISAWQLAQPPLTVVFALVLLGERVTLPMAAAGLTVLAGTALTQLKPRR